MKETFTTSVAVSGKGDTKAKAFADALSRVQHEVLRNANKILLRIEPQDVRVVRAGTRHNRKIPFLFLARERRLFSVDLEVTINVTCLDGDKVEFTRV
ncbi:DUF4312 family protein [Pantoea ananatis]